jgi:DNA repair exonuclease SbcCD ATPase subunit
MSELVTWGVKMPEDLKEKISGLLKESGLQGKEFVECLVALYESSNMKQNQPLLTQDLEEVETIARRLLSIFTNIGERVTVTLRDREDQYNSKFNQQHEISNMLHGKVKDLEQEINDLKGSNDHLRQVAEEVTKEKVTLKNDYVTNISQLTELLESNKALIEEYKSKNDTLAGLIDEYNDYKEKVKGLTVEIHMEQEVHRVTKESLSLMQSKAGHLEQQVKEIKEKHKEELQTLKDKLNIECEKESLKKDREYQNMIQSIREEYNTKVKLLLDEIENIRGSEMDKGSKKK